MLWDKLSDSFRVADTNKDKELDRNEFIVWCTNMGLRDRNMSSKMFDNVDADYSGKVNMQEFVYALTNYITKNNLI